MLLALILLSALACLFRRLWGDLAALALPLWLAVGAAHIAWWCGAAIPLCLLAGLATIPATGVAGGLLMGRQGSGTMPLLVGSLYAVAAGLVGYTAAPAIGHLIGSGTMLTLVLALGGAIASARAAWRMGADRDLPERR